MYIAWMLFFSLLKLLFELINSKTKAALNMHVNILYDSNNKCFACMCLLEVNERGKSGYDIILDF